MKTEAFPAQPKGSSNEQSLALRLIADLLDDRALGLVAAQLVVRVNAGLALHAFDELELDVAEETVSVVGRRLRLETSGLDPVAITVLLG